MASEKAGRRVTWILATALATCPAALLADISLSLRSVAGGVPLLGSGNPTASLDFGTVSKLGPLTSGVSRTTTATSYTISTLFGVRVARTKGSTPNYTLRARLLSSHPIVWRVDNVAMTTSFQSVAFSQPYGPTVSHTLGFTVSDATATGSTSTTVEFLAIAN